MGIKQAIILAGGLGTRLRSSVPDLPKCMVPVAGKPFLHYVIKYFQSQAVDDFIFSLGYMHEHIQTFLSTELSSDQYQLSIEDEPLGTGGAIRLACSKATHKTVLTLNGDTFFKINLAELASVHEQAGADCTLSLKPMHNFDRYGMVELDREGCVKSFQEKKFYKEGLINGGVYALNTGNFLEEQLPDKFSFEKDYLEKYFQQGHVFGSVQKGYFIDIGIPADYQRAQGEFERGIGNL